MYLTGVPWPVFIGFTDDPILFAREMRRINLDDEMPPFVLKKGGATTHFMRGDDGMLRMVITIEGHRKQTKAVVAALIAHEAVHVWEHVCDEMGGPDPQGEHAAYGVQWITVCILEHLWRKGK